MKVHRRFFERVQTCDVLPMIHFCARFKHASVVLSIGGCTVGVEVGFIVGWVVGVFVGAPVLSIQHIFGIQY